MLVQAKITFAVLFSLLAAVPAAAEVGAPADLRWHDTRGRIYGPEAVREADATVFVFSSTTCPCANGYNGRVEELARDLVPRGVRFFRVFVGADAEPSLVAAYVAARKLTVPSVPDPDGALAALLKAGVTPTAVVLDRQGKVRYRGRIDDNPNPQAVVREDLREALTDLLSGRPVRQEKTSAIGCAIQVAANNPAERRPILEDGLGDVDFPVTTASAEAQRYFNQGMSRWFGFNFPEAEASFREAVRLDPGCAMAHWGIALSLGMTYNFDFEPERLPEADAAVQRALDNAAGATPRERALIEALAVRHTPGKAMMEQLRPYHAAMARVYFADPADVNVAVLYAASGMDLNPWKLWTPDGQPAPGTLEVILVLEDAMRRDPNHIGANHYYIHATEASPHPERALEAAARLAAQAPNSGHLVHMPSHTYIRLGDYRAAAVANRRAAAIDAAYFEAVGQPTPYAGYYLHNLDFIVASLLFDGQSREAIAVARELSREAGRLAPDFGPVFCAGGSGLMTIYSRFGMWDEIMRAPAPLPDDPFANLAWRYARGMALVAQGKPAEAEQELAALKLVAPMLTQAASEIPFPGMPEGFALVARTAEHHLAGRLAAAAGDGNAAIRHYQQAIAAEDAIPYLEPPLWRHPVRESLGALLLTQGRPAEAEAEFREALRVHPHSGRALFGLAEALQRQNKAGEAADTRRRFEEAWARADVMLTLGDL
jgi:tetratricopeptide (TPR) repeat protein